MSHNFHRTAWNKSHSKTPQVNNSNPTRSGNLAHAPFELRFLRRLCGRRHFDFAQTSDAAQFLQGLAGRIGEHFHARLGAVFAVVFEFHLCLTLAVLQKEKQLKTNLKRSHYRSGRERVADVFWPLTLKIALDGTHSSARTRRVAIRLRTAERIVRFCTLKRRWRRRPTRKH